VKIIIILALTLGIYLLFSGSNGINDAISQANSNIKRLRYDLDSGQVQNARLIQEYASYLKTKKPAMASLIDVLSQSDSSKGPLFQSLVKRLKIAQQDKDQFSSTKQRLGELRAIAFAAEPANFNGALGDVVNTLASMSGGELPKIYEGAGASQNKEAPGEQLVGNPTYGRWQTDNSGSSFWAWYGKYALFSSLMNVGFGQRYYYNRWAGNRPYSYYNDVGRNYFSSEKNLRRERTLERNRKNKFQRSGKRFTSTYQKYGTGRSSTFRRSSSGSSSRFFSRRSNFSRSSFRSGGRSVFSSGRSAFGGGK